MNKLNHIITGSVIAASIITFGNAYATNAHAQDADFQFTYSEKLQKDITEKYGEKEKAVLEKIIKDEVSPKLDKNAAKVEIKINDVTPNRPTFEQMGKNVSLSYQSFGIGGADLEGLVYDKDGKLIRDAKYNYYATLTPLTPHKWTWDDAEDAIRGFARKLNKVAN